jgi:hypothetical protein
MLKELRYYVKARCCLRKEFEKSPFLSTFQTNVATEPISIGLKWKVISKP